MLNIQTAALFAAIAGMAAGVRGVSLLCNRPAKPRQHQIKVPIEVQTEIANHNAAIDAKRAARKAAKLNKEI
jgi:hypothetical protein